MFLESTYPTIGVEEEFHLIDPQSAELVPMASQIIDDSACELRSHVCNELFESIIEIRSEVHRDCASLRSEIVANRKNLSAAARERNVAIAAAGSHPFSDWRKQVMVNQDHYRWVQDQFHSVAQRLIAMGLHVHVGVKNDKAAFYVMSKMKRWAPALTAFSCNSPFFEGEDYGFKSTRMHLFHGLPRTGFLPDFKSLDEYEEFYETLRACGDVLSMKDMWWTVRPKPEFGTVEYRLFDLPTDVNRIYAIVALVQAATAYYQDQFFDKRGDGACCNVFLNECMWKSYRDGLDAVVADPFTGRVVTAKSMLQELIELTREKADELGSADAYRILDAMIDKPTEADNQKDFFYAHDKDFKALELEIARRTTLY